jgi:hypothetical protein
MSRAGFELNSTIRIDLSSLANEKEYFDDVICMLHFPLRALQFNIYSFYQPIHTIVIRFAIIFLKTLNSYMFRISLVHVNVIPDDDVEPNRPESCRSLMFFKISLWG